MLYNRRITLLGLAVFMACTGRDHDAVAPPAVMFERSRTVQADSLRLHPAEGLVYCRGEVFTGTSVTYYGNGHLASQIDFFNGKKHGFYRKWYEDGQISFESHYMAGSQDGMTCSWWRNGNKRSASTYRQGVPHGQQMQWYKSGAKFKIIHLADGREEGLQQAWRENGKLYNNYEARNGRTFGLKRANLCYALEDESIQIED